MIYCPMAYAPNDSERKFSPDYNWITSAFEVNQFNTKQHQLGDKYVFYIDDSMVGVHREYSTYIDKALAITWMGDILGHANLGHSYRNNRGSKSRKVWITDNRGNVWHGQYSYQNQDCVYAKLIKLGSNQNGIR